MTIKNIIQLFLLLIATVLLTGISILAFPLNYFFKAYHHISRTWAKMLVTIARIKINVSGLENIEENKNYVLVSNHASHFDIPIILSSLKTDIKMMAKKELLYVPFLGCSLLAGGYIIIDRKKPKSAMKAMRKAKDIQKKNSSILLFPEGTRSENGEIQDFKKGAFLIARTLKMEILPISLYGSHKIMPKKSFVLKPGTVYMQIDKPMNIEKLSREDNKNLVNIARDKIKNNIDKIKDRIK